MEYNYNNSAQDNLTKLQEQKAKLEIEKLEREIGYQKQPFKNPQNWSPFATIIAGACAIVWAISSGWFTNQSDKLEIKNAKLEQQRQTLEKDVTQFSITKKEIQDSIAILSLQLNNLQGLVNAQDTLLDSPESLLAFYILKSWDEDSTKEKMKLSRWIREQLK